ncbi:MAG: BCCT family transporter [Pseudomonadales bacterium]
MQLILSIAILLTLLTSLYIVVRWGNLRCEGSMPTSLFTFSAILFTSGLDVGLIMFPLTEFPLFEQDEAYNFANPLAMEFGFWGFLVWTFYFLTTFYFCVVEPRVKLFEIPIIRLLNNLVIISTCSFTGYLFLSYLPSYIDGISAPLQYSLVAIVVLFAVLSSTDVKYVKILSISSTWVFFALIAGMWLASDMGFIGFTANAAMLSEYFTNIHHFVTPITDTHAFYLFWWFSWSIMIGQFVARFLSAMKTWQLLLALMIIPSIPIAVWFSVLYYYHTNAIEINGVIKLAMVTVGIVFVMNSLDSLIRLYTVNLNLTMDTIGKRNYILGNWITMFGLILIYNFTPFKIEWVGLIVIGIYAAIYALLFTKRNDQVLMDS